MPGKIVENSDFNRDNRGGAVIQFKAAFENSERNELNADSDKADGVELQPNADSAIHGMRSSL
jgi:hypothetical protein